MDIWWKYQKSNIWMWKNWFYFVWFRKKHKGILLPEPLFCIDIVIVYTVIDKYNGMKENWMGIGNILWV